MRKNINGSHRLSSTHKNNIPAISALVILLALTLSACGSGNADATPTFSLDAIYTSAAQTFTAQQATQLALTPPTTPTMVIRGPCAFGRLICRPIGDGSPGHHSWASSSLMTAESAERGPSRSLRKRPARSGMFMVRK